MKERQSLLTIQQVAEQLQVTAQSVYKLVRAAELPAVRVGHVYRVSASDLEKFLSEHQVGREA